MNTTRSINPESSVKIEGVEEPTIATYFSTLNRGEFTTTADLFAAAGCLNPPFENPIEGRAAIAKYLETEARGMILCPEFGVLLIKDNGVAQYHIQGQVKTNYFTINVTWLFQLNSDNEICLVEIKLLADLEELLKFKK